MLPLKFKKVSGCYLLDGGDFCGICMWTKAVVVINILSSISVCHLMIEKLLSTTLSV